MTGRKERKQREVYGGEPREEWRGLGPYFFAGIAYIACGQVYPGILYSSFTGMIFLLACVWVLPRLWKRVR